MKDRLLLIGMVAITLLISALSWHYFGDDAAGILSGKPDSVKHWLPLVLRVHIAFGMLAMASGAALWFTSRKPGRYPIHRWLGRFYALSILISGTGAAIIAPYAIGGLVSTMGFLSLGIAWWYFTARSVQLAMTGDIQRHRKAASYSLALTYSSFTFRLFLLIPLLTNVPFVPLYRVDTWISWMINLGLVAIYYRLRNRSITPTLQLL